MNGIRSSAQRGYLFRSYPRHPLPDGRGSETIASHFAAENAMFFDVVGIDFSLVFSRPNPRRRGSESVE
jgi:hypothetical protein